METNYIFFKSRDEILRIDTSAIVYFEADGNYTHIILANGLKGLMCMNLARMQKTLELSMKDKARRFVRIGKRYIINMNYIYHVHVLHQSVILSDQKTFSYEIQISKEALRNLKELIEQSVSRQ